MANRRISDYTALGATPVSGDLIEIVDVSDTTDAVTGTNKKVTFSNFISTLLTLSGGIMTGDIDMGDNNLNNIAGTSFNVTDDGNSGAADTINWTVGSFHKSVLTSATVTYTFTDPFTGGTDVSRLELKVIQDATGGRDVTWPANIVWPEGEPTWTDGTANQKIRITFIYDDNDNQYIGQATSWYT